MTNSKKILLVFLFALFSTTAQAQNYYVCDTGDDENDGKSEATPFKTFDKGISTFNGMFAGSNVLFCRGGRFPITTDLRIYNKNCGAIKPCTIADYGDIAKPKPLFNASGDLTAFNFQEGGNADSDGGYNLKNLTIIAQNSKGKGVFLYNDVDDVILDNLHIEGFRIGIHSSGANTLNPGTNGINDRLVVTNNTIINNRSIGFHGACQDCLIEGNYFENNGFGQKILDHNIYLAWSKSHAENITVRNNTLYRSTIIDGKCYGVSLVVHGLFTDLTIENNIVKEDLGKVSGYCWGISVDPGYSKTDESFYNVKILNNKLINVGNVGIGCASCEGAVIHGNEIIDEGEVLIMGIKVPVREENTLKSNNISIKNNKVILNHLNGYGISIGGASKIEVLGNDIRLPNNTKNDCIQKSGMNVLTDTSNNLCQLHNGISIIEPNDEEEAFQDDFPVAEIPNEQPTDEEELEFVDKSPTIEESINQTPESNDNTPVQEDNQTEEVANNKPGNENTDLIIESTDNVQLYPKNAPNSGINGTSTVFNEQQTYDGNSSSMDKNKTSKNAGGGASSGGSSKSKTASTSNDELKVLDEVISYTTPVSDTSSNMVSVETDKIDTTEDLQKLDTESSKYSVKLKDVIEASYEENKVVDVTECRAYAAGRCLMK
ncbi:hypothetical protein [Methylophaga pinxianii]|uniref:hypothetical protein n=1 Tax=Methylophaga pinxianii TaxID=2881052 RepID=UPI001CF1108A|nr:hypothetical protein [Methylophaga pinxianii]MCB2425876.1 hypothetical protein [Methylophaga pinxianii]UPH45116.1 hypothetical protein LGT42_011430 [Methylophaga pinxianii]